jgi:hypothetical protein
MKNKKWIDTKIEYEYNSDGEAIPKKVTRELEKSWFGRNKDEIDTIFRFIGIAGIAIPFLLFYFQIENQRKQEQRQQYINTYTDLSKNTRNLLTVKDLKGMSEIYDKITIENSGKILALQDKAIRDTFKFLMFCVNEFRLQLALAEQQEQISELISSFAPITESDSYYDSVQIIVSSDRTDEYLKEFQSHYDTLYAYLLALNNHRTFEDTSKVYQQYYQINKQLDSVLNLFDGLEMFAPSEKKNFEVFNIEFHRLNQMLPSWYELSSINDVIRSVNSIDSMFLHSTQMKYKD